MKIFWQSVSWLFLEGEIFSMYCTVKIVVTSGTDRVLEEKLKGSVMLTMLTFVFVYNLIFYFVNAF